MIGIKTIRAMDASGEQKSLSLLDADAWEQIFPDAFSGKRRPSLTKLFRVQGYLRRAVTIRANAVSDIPWEIVPRGEEDADPVLTSDMTDVPDELAYLRGFRRVLYEVEASLAVLGCAYRLIEQDQGAITNLKLWPAQQVTPSIDRREGVTGYKRVADAFEEEAEAEDVLAIHAPDPFAEVRAPGDGKAAELDAAVLNSLAIFLDRHLRRGMIKGTLLTVEGGAPKEERKRLESWWKRFFGGADTAGETKVVNAAVEPKQIGEGVGELGNTELDERAREAVATAMGVPHSKLFSNASNYATAEKDDINFIQDTVLPEARLIRDDVNNQVLHSQELHLRFLPERLEVLQRYELEKAEKVSMLTGRPILTVDEARDLLGYEPLEDDEALPEQAPDSAGEVSVEDMSPEAEDELRKWEKKARRHGRQASFEAHHIPRPVQKTIRTRLNVGEPLETAFEPPWTF